MPALDRRPDRKYRDDRIADIDRPQERVPVEHRKPVSSSAPILGQAAVLKGRHRDGDAREQTI
jgi:hypothetical protein